MICDTPYIKEVKGRLEPVPLPCGKCPNCKMRRVKDWIFRLREEDKISSCSAFVTLTYDTKFVPISKNNFMTLDKRDCQLFFKRLRKRLPNGHPKIKYYLVGEYGDERDRPHYHIILFNTRDIEALSSAWGKGTVHMGNVSGPSIAYTTKYIDKAKRIPLFESDDRLPEFQLTSKNLGLSYLTEQTIAWHKRDVNNLFIPTSDGYNISLPKYYRDKIFTDAEKRCQVDHIQRLYKERDILKEKEVKILYPGMDLDTYKQLERRGRYNSFYNNQKPRNNE